MIEKKVRTKYSQEFVEQAMIPGGVDEYIKKNLVKRLIDDMSIDELSKIFKFRVISWKDSISPTNPDWLNEKIRQLQIERCNEIEVSILK